MGKGEIARYEQFLLFPQCFQRLVLQTRIKPVTVWEKVNKIVENINKKKNVDKFKRDN